MTCIRKTTLSPVPHESIPDKPAELKPHNDEIVQLRDEINRQRQILELLTARAYQKECERTAHESRAENLEYQLRRLKKSSSWRLTAPIRQLSKSFRERSRTVRQQWFQKKSAIKKTSYQEWIIAYDTVSAKQKKLIKKKISSIDNRPVISIIIPETPDSPEFLKKCLDSILNQVYPEWEIYIAGNCSAEPAIRTILNTYVQSDKRIRYIVPETHNSSCESCNSALELACGGFIALLSPDDQLHPLALYYAALEINQHPEAVIIFSDEDKINEQGERVDPFFKPDFNYHLFLCQNMLSRFCIYKTSLIHETGGFRKEVGSVTDYDIALRIVEKVSSEHIRHIPRVLYHRRKHTVRNNRTNIPEKGVRQAMLKCIEEHLKRIQIDAIVEPAPEAPQFNRIRYISGSLKPSVDIIILTRDKPELLESCIRSIIEKTTYSNHTISIVDNCSIESRTLELLSNLKSEANIRVIKDDSPFNFSQLNNRAVDSSRADFICLMNNDIEVITLDWLDEMMSHAVKEKTGAVGARLWYPDDTLQHGGVILGIGGIAYHAHKHLPKGEIGYYGRACLQQNVTAVTGACLLVARKKYLEVGGLNEQHLTVGCNDIDLCLKLHRQGYENIWTPYAEHYHHESASRGYDDTILKKERAAKEAEYMKSTWKELLFHDPTYNLNLSLTPGKNAEVTFELAWPPRHT